MTREEQFNFRLTPYEKSLIVAMAQKLQRSECDAVRLVVTSVARELVRQEQTQPVQEKPQTGQ